MGHKFLQSPAWQCLTKNSSGNSSPFCLLTTRPSVTISEICCDNEPPDSPTVCDVSVPAQATGPLSLPHQDDLLIASSAPFTGVDTVAGSSAAPLSSTQATPRPKRGKSTHISVADLRRSQRIHMMNGGFKTSFCRDKDCLGCSSNPPLLSSSVVRDLGSTFCNIDAANLTDDKLLAKPSRKKPVTKPKSKAKDSKGGKKDPEAGSSAKKSKK